MQTSVEVRVQCTPLRSPLSGRSNCIPVTIVYPARELFIIIIFSLSGLYSVIVGDCLL